MDWRLIGKTYALAFAAVSSFVVPLAYLIYRSDGRAATTIEMIIMFAFSACPTALYFWIEKYRKTLLERSLGGTLIDQHPDESQASDDFYSD